MDMNQIVNQEGFITTVTLLTVIVLIGLLVLMLWLANRADEKQSAQLAYDNNHCPVCKGKVYIIARHCHRCGQDLNAPRKAR